MTSDTPKPQPAAIKRHLTTQGAALITAIERLDRANTALTAFTDKYSAALAELGEGLPRLVGAQIAAMTALHEACTALQVDGALHPDEGRRSFLGKKRRR